MERQAIEIPLERGFIAFEQSFNKIKYFLCITDNLTASNLPNSWSIKSSELLNHMVTPIPDEKKEYILDGYKYFVRCNLVRDVIESFALCIDELFVMSLLHGKKIEVGMTPMDTLSEEERIEFKKFQRLGLIDKVNKYEEALGIEIDKDAKSVLENLKDIRNCLAHSNGFVRDTDGQNGKDGDRLFKWRTFSVFAKGVESGKRYELEVSRAFEEEVQIFMQFAEHEKLVPVGRPLLFKTIEVYEIGFTLQQIAHGILGKLGKSKLARAA